MTGFLLVNVSIVLECPLLGLFMIWQFPLNCVLLKFVLVMDVHILTGACMYVQTIRVFE